MAGGNSWVVRSCFEAAGAVVLAFAIANAAHAATCNTGTNPPTVSATTVAFGTYNASTPAANTSNGTVTVRCVSATRTLPTFTVSLSRGGASTYATRRMAFAANTLLYNIYTTSAFTTIWGDGTSSTGIQSYNASALLNTISYTTFGRVSAGQYARAGSYTDTITVTVTY